MFVVTLATSVFQILTVPFFLKFKAREGFLTYVTDKYWFKLGWLIDVYGMFLKCRKNTNQTDILILFNNERKRCIANTLKRGLMR